MGRRANLRPGAARNIRPGDRWLVRLRGATRAVPCYVLRRLPHRHWRVRAADTEARLEVPEDQFLGLLPPAPDPVQDPHLAVEMLRVRHELRRLADEIVELRERIG